MCFAPDDVRRLVTAIVPSSIACAMFLAFPSALPQDSRPAAVHSFELATIDGKAKKLSDYAGKTLLIVNVASDCGYTPQYDGLQKLHDAYSQRGFLVLGFPSNDFGGQEPGTDAEIRRFCSTRHKVTFPLFSKLSVAGANASPLYRFLQEESPVRATVKWNFHKFLVGPDGRVIASFGTKVAPGAPELTAAIEASLAESRPASRAASRPAK